MLFDDKYNNWKLRDAERKKRENIVNSLNKIKSYYPNLKIEKKRELVNLMDIRLKEYNFGKVELLYLGDLLKKKII
jgi:hypothetical protein